MRINYNQGELIRNKLSLTRVHWTKGLHGHLAWTPVSYNRSPQGIYSWKITGLRITTFGGYGKLRRWWWQFLFKNQSF